MKYAIIAALGLAGGASVMLLSYSLGFWYGSHCVEGTSVCSSGQTYTSGKVLSIFYSLLMLGLNISQNIISF